MNLRQMDELVRWTYLDKQSLQLKENKLLDKLFFYALALGRICEVLSCPKWTRRDIGKEHGPQVPECFLAD